MNPQSNIPNITSGGAHQHGIADVTGLQAALDAASGAVFSGDASDVPFTPTGSIEALDVQAAIAELDADISGFSVFVGDAGSGGAQGFVPAPAAGDAAASKYLRADGTWAAPAGAALSDGDKGDITVSGSGSTWNIDAGAVGTTELADDAVTYAKMQNVSATDKILGRSTSGAGNVEEITCTAAGRAILDDADASAQRTTLGFVEVSGADDDIWQRKAGVWTNRTLAQLKADIPASDTTPGVSELATASEVTTGTDAARAVTPDALAGSSIFGVKSVIVEVFAPATTVTTGDGKKKFPIPSSLNGMNLVSVVAMDETAGTTGTMDIQIARDRGGSVVDVLTTKLTIDSTEKTSATAATAAVINTSNDDVATGDFYRVDVDAVQTTPAAGLWVVFNFQLP